MKKVIMFILSAYMMIWANTSFAACDAWGTVTYVYQDSTSILAIIDGTACYVTTGDLTAAAAVLSVAQANSLQGFLASATGAVGID